MPSAPEIEVVRSNRTGLLYVRVPNGKKGGKTRIPLGTRDMDEAEAIVAKSSLIDLASVAKADEVTKIFWSRAIRGQRITVGAARDLYVADMATRGLSPLTIYDHGLRIDSWIRSAKCGVEPVGNISPKRIGDFINNPDSSTKYSTRAKMLSVLGYFFEFCRRAEYTPINPCSSISVRTIGLRHSQLIPKKKVPFTDEEIARLLAYLPRKSYWYGAILLGKHFGLRLSSVACLEWDSIRDLHRLQVYTHKGGVIVDEIIPEEVREWLSEWPRTEGSPYCFPDQAHYVLYLMHARLSAAFSRICQKCGIQGKSFHCLRVGAVTRELDRQLEQLGGPARAALSLLIAQKGMRAVQRLVGHAEGSMVTGDRYFNPQGASPQQQAG